ncbi:MAG: MarR family transcriptional regulator [Actinomycetota bacterium]|nr:MAG: MarR family transcriptional regulator [Actinomycetota bacterium]
MTRWLDAEQQKHWRAWLAASRLLTEHLNRDLIASQGLSGADYEILVRLSEAPTRALRMSELADKTLSSRSRLSHQVDRMEAAGLVVRQECPGDRRGALAVLTEAGFARLVAAAPDHVRAVRESLVDVLTDEEFAALGRACAKVVAHLTGEEPTGSACGTGGTLDAAEAVTG